MTAEEFLIKRQKELGYNPCIDLSRTKETLVEFAKIHVNLALETASKKASTTETFGGMSVSIVNKNSILNAYPLELIK